MWVIIFFLTGIIFFFFFFLLLNNRNPLFTVPRRDSAESGATMIGSSVVPLANKLQDIVASLGLELDDVSLPQVAVVGGQSSGKSSVLEALVGRDFLPRGCGICTRRPLFLMLERSADADAEFGEFRHLPGKIFHDFSKIRKEIEAETEKVAGANKGVSEKQIGLRICSPNVLNMTLIDFPGMTRVPVGDQPSDIEARIRKMIMDTITKENCIILAVTPANSDLATSDALKLAREVDPSGSRTIGVLTKLDIMDKGTNAYNFLLGKTIPLKLGYVAVVNRCQEDINHNRSIQDALELEEKFFRDNPVYKSLSDRCSIPMLAKKLNQILEQRIRMVLPKLKRELNSRLVAVGKELLSHGEVIHSEEEKGVLLINLLRKYSDAFNDLVDGKTGETPIDELSGGARIFYVFQSIFAKKLEEMDPCEDLSDAEILTAIHNASGAFGSLFVPQAPFQLLVGRQIGRFLDPSLQCLRIVHEEIMKMNRSCGATELQGFPYLQKCVDEVVVSFLCQGLTTAENMISTIIDMEKNCISVWNPSFIGGKTAIEIARSQLRWPQNQSDVPELEKISISEKDQKSDDVQSRSDAKGASSNQEHRHSTYYENIVTAGGSVFRRRLGLPSLFATKAPTVQSSLSSRSGQLREPPSTLRPHESTDDEELQVLVTKLLLQSYYDVVRKHIQDQIPKMVNPMKREIHSTLIQKLYRENRVAELLQEQEGIVVKRKHVQELLNGLQNATKTVDELEAACLWKV